MIFFHPTFKKAYRKRTRIVREHFDERMRIFEKEPFHPLLENHALHGTWKGYRSINVTGNFRAVFKQEDSVITFIDIDTHHNLYGS